MDKDPNGCEKKKRNVSGGIAVMIYSSGECGSAPAQLQQPGAPPGNAESGRGGGEKGEERPPKKKECKNKTEGPQKDKAQGRGTKKKKTKPRSRRRKRQKIWDEKNHHNGARERPSEDAERGRNKFLC